MVSILKQIKAHCFKKKGVWKEKKGKILKNYCEYLHKVNNYVILSLKSKIKDK